MATEASIASLEADQKKLQERIDRFEGIMKKIYTSFLLLFGENIPYDLKKLGEEWAAADKTDEVIVKPPKVCS